jgi:hypothetical protein
MPDRLLVHRGRRGRRRRGRLDMGVLLNDLMVESVVVSPREQLPAFQVFDPSLKLDAAACVFPTDSTDDICGRHWPLLGEKLRREL